MLFRHQTTKATASVNVDINLDATGRSVDALLGDLEGQATVIARQGGRIDDAQLNRLVPDLDLLNVLPPFWSRAQSINVNCFVGQFDVDQGVAQTDALLDTRRMTVLGGGTVNLKRGRLDLTLDPKSKSRKLSATGVPVEVQGPITSPNIQPVTDETVGRVIGSALGGLLLPLNQIAGLLGPEATDACKGAVRKARERIAGLP